MGMAAVCLGRIRAAISADKMKATAAPECISTGGLTLMQLHHQCTFYRDEHDHVALKVADPLLNVATVGWHVKLSPRIGLLA